MGLALKGIYFTNIILNAFTAVDVTKITYRKKYICLVKVCLIVVVGFLFCFKKIVA